MDNSITISQAIEYAQTQYGESYHFNTFYRWIKEGKLRAFRRGGQWRVYQDSIDDFFCPKIENTSNKLEGRPA
jgi:excisionase family DNA binding protein